MESHHQHHHHHYANAFDGAFFPATSVTTLRRNGIVCLPPQCLPNSHADMHAQQTIPLDILRRPHAGFAGPAASPSAVSGQEHHHGLRHLLTGDWHMYPAPPLLLAHGLTPSQTHTPSMPSPRTSSRTSLYQTSRSTGPLSPPPRPFSRPWMRASKDKSCLYISV